MAILVMTEIEPLATIIRKRLNDNADPAYREKISKLVPTEIDIVGVRVPVIRTLVQAFRSEHPDLPVAAMMALLDRAFGARCREELLFATILLTARRKALAEIDWNRVDRWVDGIEDWEVCDQLSMGIIGELVVRDLSRVDALVTWASGPNRWRRRAALAASTSLNQKGRNLPMKRCGYARR
ncbi:MAG: DNA alkylation repair protein [Proteobacteria bacterium]|nr:DNA alkylation repair protein [Pseudomonadota bacterium]